MLRLKKTAVFLALVLTVTLIIFDARFHFDSDIVELKITHHSAQRNWNLFFGQHHVYNSGGINHEFDIKRISELVEPGSVLISDIATSYYLASGAPIYIKNVHRHHGLRRDPFWGSFLIKGIACYLELPENMTALKKGLRSLSDDYSSLNGANIYFAVNLTSDNKNFARDCLSQRRSAFLAVIDQFATPVFEGKTILLFKAKEPI